MTFEGLDSVTLYTGTDELAEFDPMEGVTAANGETDLTESIEVVGTVATTVMEMNRFTLAYIIENENGPMAIGYRTIVVRLGKENSYDLMNGTFDENINFWVQDVNAQNPDRRNSRGWRATTMRAPRRSISSILLRKVGTFSSVRT